MGDNLDKQISIRISEEHYKILTEIGDEAIPKNYVSEIVRTLVTIFVQNYQLTGNGLHKFYRSIELQIAKNHGKGK